ncbi:MAG: transposase [Clostridia bacterium]
MEFKYRKRMRLTNYNYSQCGVYFITICSHNQNQIFSQLVGNGLDRSIFKLTQYGIIAENELKNIEKHFPCVEIDKYVVMPNHIHIIILMRCNGELERSRPFPTISTIIGLYKSGVSKLIHEIDPNQNVWQKSFHDHIIRNEKSYQKIWQYIDENPLKWKFDKYYCNEM